MTRILTRISRYCSNLPKQIQWHRSLPRNSFAEDIFLVSFPKSGNTWLRFLIANTLKVHYKIQRDVNFFTVHEFIPDVHLAAGFMNIHDGGIFGNPEIPRIIKSHSTYNNYYQRVILLVRDPRDVLISYFFHQKRIKQISEDYTLSDFIRHEKYGVKAWNKHTESWINTIRSGQIIKIFRYEDILNDTHTELSRLMDLLGIRVEASNLARAIELSSKENMRNSEINHASTFIVQAQKNSFIRQGKSTGGKDLLDSDRKFVEDFTFKTSQKIGYNY